MNFKQIILENLNRNQAVLAAKVLCSKIESKYTVAVASKNANKQTYSIINELDKDWSTIVFKFSSDNDQIAFNVFVDDASRAKLIDVYIKTTPNNDRHLKLVGQGFTDLVNRLYKLLNSDQEITFNQLKPAFEHISQVEKYINHDNKLLQNSNS